MPHKITTNVNFNNITIILHKQITNSTHQILPSLYRFGMAIYNPRNKYWKFIQIIYNNLFNE